MKKLKNSNIANMYHHIVLFPLLCTIPESTPPTTPSLETKEPPTASTTNKNMLIQLVPSS